MTRAIDLKKVVLEDLYVKQKLSYRKIAKILGCGGTTILTYLHKYQLPIRSKIHSRDYWVRLGKNNKGRKQSEEAKNKIRQWHIGKSCSTETKKKLSIAFRGDKNPAWRGGKIKYRGWDFIVTRKQILERDNNRCQICFVYAKDVHHLIPYRITKDNSFFNLLTLCNKHHKYMDNEFDKKYQKYGGQILW